MGEAMSVLVLLILFSGARSLDTGTNGSTLVNSSAHDRPPVIVYRNSMFNLGSDVHLTCSQKTWNETIYVIWKISLRNRNCSISQNEGRNLNFCQDGKSLQNTTHGQSYLHIPNFSIVDTGTYKCECVYNGGKEVHIITVNGRVPPKTSARLERGDNKMVAVCKAEGGNPAANISWSHAGNKPPREELRQADGLFTVESRLELPEHAQLANLSCEVRHPAWNGTKVLVPEPLKANFPWLYIVVGVVIVVTLVGFLSFILKKQIMWRRRHQPDTPSSKLSPSEEVEEVEPYASYVQRVNSIYNSSADLFT